MAVARSSEMVKFFCVAVLGMVVVGGPHAEAAAITCDQVTNAVRPCLFYLKNPMSPAPAACCGSVNSLAATLTTPDRQAAVCACLQKLAGGVSGLNPGAAAGLPRYCAARAPYNISPITDCNNKPL